jgi:glycosyltransferase involved in cell wall biosynthesis
VGVTTDLSSLRVALVHDWLLGMRGGERVLEELCRLFPRAAVYSFFHEAGAVSPAIESHPIRVSGINRIPFARRFHRATLPLLPLAVEALRIEPCDLVISTSHCVAGSVRPPASTPHVSICFTPMRYLWGMERDYVGTGLRRALLGAAAVPLRAWDRRTHDRVTRFVAISEYVRERIRLAYGREADVVFPPVDVERFRPIDKPQDYFLVVSALVPYKRIDLVVEAFRGRSDEVWIAGTGPLLGSLRRSAPPNVRFLGWVPDDELPGIVAGARALVFPTEDEFGIVPVEAQAAGRPVIALGRGGAAETVIPPGRGAVPTGVWFERQTAAGLADAIDRLLAIEDSFDPAAIRRHALSFSAERFRAEILSIVSDTLAAPSRVA